MNNNLTTQTLRTRFATWCSPIALAALTAAVLTAGAGTAAAQGLSVHREVAALAPSGSPTYLIADQYNNRVVEIDRLGNILWQFGRGPNDFSPSSIIGVNDAERVGPLTLMVGTGTGPFAAPGCPNTSGCPDNRVLLVNRERQIVWQYGTFGVTGGGPNQLNAPSQASYLPSGNLLITDQGNQRVIEVNMQREVVWQYGITGIAGSGVNMLNQPSGATLLANGNILIADQANSRAIEVTRAQEVVAEFTVQGTARGIAFASRLPNGNTLLTDMGNARIVEVDSNDVPAWEYRTDGAPGSNTWPLPSRAVRLASGNTLISDQFNHRVIEVNREKTIVRSFGNLNVPGYGIRKTSEGLDAPHDAKVIGDPTGLTPLSAPADATVEGQE